jgi:hypothetical protein
MKLSKMQRTALADAYDAYPRRGLHRSVNGWSDPSISGSEYHSHSTIRSLERNGLLEFWVNRTVVHVTEHGRGVHENLCEASR